MSAFRILVASVSALFLSVALLLMGSGLLATLLPVRAHMEGFSDVEIGILGSSYFVGFAAGCLTGPLFIARVGHIRAYLAFVCISSSGALLHALVLNVALWGLLRSVTGFCFAALFVIIESWLNERSSNQNRGTILSIYATINLTVVTIGQMLLTLGDPGSFALFALTAILVSLAGVPVALTRSQSPETEQVIFPRLRRLFALSPIGVLGCLAVGLTNGAFWSLGPVFALKSSLDFVGIALFMSLTVLGGAIGQWPLGRISDSIDRRRVILPCCILAALAGLALDGLQQEDARYLLWLGFGFGFFAFPIYALCVAHANDASVPANYVEVSSGLLFVFALGAILGPTIAALAGARLETQSLFVFTAAVHSAMAGFAIWRMSRRSPASSDEKVEFTDALVAAQTVAPLDVIESEKQADKPVSKSLL